MSILCGLVRVHAARHPHLAQQPLRRADSHVEPAAAVARALDRPERRAPVLGELVRLAPLDVDPPGHVDPRFEGVVGTLGVR